MKLNKKESLEIINNGIIASLSICNNASIDIYQVNDDNVIWAYSFENDILRSSKLRSKFIDDDTTKESFRVGKDWFNLDEFLRIGIY